MIRPVATAAAVCVGSWVGLLLGAGNVGLQRSVSLGPLRLFEHPLAVVLATGLAFVIALGVTVWRRPGEARSLLLVAAVLFGDAMGALVLAPLAVGELTPLDAPLVFAVLAVVGLQPLATYAGAALPRMLRSA